MAPPDTAGPQLEAVGEPVALDDLRLFDTGIGPLTIGDDGTVVVGRLVASLGQPDADTGTIPGDGRGGQCPGTPVREVRWGTLAIFNVVEIDGAQTFDSYRLDTAFTSESDPAAGLATRSGLRLGESVAQLRSIYAGFDLRLGDLGLGYPSFELRSGDDGSLLLWGSLTSEHDDGIVTGIQSPHRCSEG